jgi:hypothetical protein
MNASIDIYGGVSPVDAPAYTPGIAAHYLGLPAATVRYWVVGRGRYRPVIKPADPEEGLLSFRNLVELHVLSAIRRYHEVSLPAVRRALDYLRTQFGSARPLSDEHLLTDRTSLFVEKYGELVDVSANGQMAIRQALIQHLQRIDRDALHQPVRLFPFTWNPDGQAPIEGPRSVVIDPQLAFGKPCLAGSGIPTLVVVQRFKAGEPIESIAEDYGRDPKKR